MTDGEHGLPGYCGRDNCAGRTPSRESTARIWAIVVPVASAACAGALAWVLAMNGKSASSEMLASTQKAAIDRHEVTLDAIKQKQATDSERIRGIEIDMAYIRSQTSEIAKSVNTLASRGGQR